MSCVFLSRMVVGLAKVSDPRLWEAADGAQPYVVQHGLIDSGKAPTAGLPAAGGNSTGGVAPGAFPAPLSTRLVGGIRAAPGTWQPG